MNKLSKMIVFVSTLFGGITCLLLSYYLTSILERLILPMGGIALIFTAGCFFNDITNNSEEEK